MPEPVLIIGNGTCAATLAGTLLQAGAGVILVYAAADPDKAMKLRPGPNLEILGDTTVRGCSGTAGSFKIRLQNNQGLIDRTVSAIVVAEEHRYQPNYSLYGITPARSVLSLTKFKQLLSSDPPGDGKLNKAKQIVFLSGLLLESHPVSSETVMRLCLRLQNDYGIQTVVLTGNLKVAANGLENLHRQSQKAGAVYVKFTNGGPRIRQSNGSVTVDFEDEISGQRFRLTPDLTVVDEMILPSARLAHLAEVLKIDAGPEGYLQTDNVRRTGLLTNRKGILAAGPARRICSEKDSFADAEAAALAVRQLTSAFAVAAAGHAVIDPEKCIRCLTCYRLCPHGAVIFNSPRPAVVSESCENCGLCVSECPRRAIAATGSEMLNRAEAPGPVDVADDIFEPKVTALCCGRSAVPAWQQSVMESHRQPRQLSVVTVPCGAGVSMDMIYRAFLQGADGVMILTCHQGNCHSEQGCRHASREAARVRDFFEQTGFETERLFFDTIAANMSAGFSEKIARFAATIRKLGPSRLRTR
ncbi:MAG: hydrogenase iron-sulfur subunit [Thermodesulfobacteriota bacterium]